MSREDRLLYRDPGSTARWRRPWIEHAWKAAEALVMVFPTWVFAAAILKELLREGLPAGVFAFKLVDGKVRGAMRRRARRRIDLRQRAGAPSGGRPAAAACSLVRCAPHETERADLFQGCYDMNRIDEARGKTFLANVKAAILAW